YYGLAQQPASLSASAVLVIPDLSQSENGTVSTLRRAAQNPVLTNVRSIKLGIFESEAEEYSRRAQLRQQQLKFHTLHRVPDTVIEIADADTVAPTNVVLV